MLLGRPALAQQQIPDQVIAATRQRYVQAYERLTGESFDAWLTRR
jgi:phosphoribosylaminoimidazole-succinocarboxamide synthase